MTDAFTPITVAAGACTDVGLRRSINEDSLLAAYPLFLVADGMGGHQAGEVASAAVIAAFATLAGRASLTIDDVHDAVERARRAVDELPLLDGGGAGTTLTGVVVAEVAGAGCWLTLNLGDSRTYRQRDGVLEQISVDHSVVQELIDRGELDPQAAAEDARRNVITRAIGAGSDSVPDYWLLPAEQGDRILVCSDGLTGELAPDRIALILGSEPDPQTAATRLVHEAVLHGGRDNVTALVVAAVAVHARRSPQDESADDDEVDEDTLPRAVSAV